MALREITQEEAQRAIELLVRVSDRAAGFVDYKKPFIEDEITDFLFDHSGDCRFDLKDPDNAPFCNC